ncbi:metallophosphoesterase [Candidatus Woesebacteria bacterium]|nr:metallophosphoesterase [Candidatus Woesebacteria bacterium]
MIRFIHISDTHIGPTEEFTLQGMNSFRGFRAVLGAIQNLPFKPDFIIHTGDVVADPDEASYKLFASMVHEIDIPMYYVTGNHDDSLMLKNAVQIGTKKDLMEEKLVYSFEKDDHQFLVIDGRGPREIDPHGTISDQQMKVVESQISKSQSQISIFIHFPLLSMDCRWIDRDMLLLEGEKLHALFVKHSDKIQGVFHGHVHRGTHITRDGIQYISAASTFLQFGIMPDQEAPTFENHGRGYFNMVTIENGKMTVKEESVEIIF